MKWIISPPQGVFIEGRQILDGVLIANECIEEKRESERNGVICKLDLEKAYDHVNWKFFYNILKIMGFGAKWRSWISFYLHSSSFSILVNGCSKGFFGGSRGLRQGSLCHRLYL